MPPVRQRCRTEGDRPLAGRAGRLRTTAHRRYQGRLPRKARFSRELLGEARYVGSLPMSPYLRLALTAPQSTIVLVPVWRPGATGRRGICQGEKWTLVPAPFTVGGV